MYCELLDFICVPYWSDKFSRPERQLILATAPCTRLSMLRACDPSVQNHVASPRCVWADIAHCPNFDPSYSRVESKIREEYNFNKMKYAAVEEILPGAL